MARVSRFKLRDEVWEKVFQMLFYVVGKRRDNKEFNNVVKELLSPNERIMIGKRLVIMYLLLKKIDHKTICKVVKVSSGTVAKFSILMQINNYIAEIMTRLIALEGLSDFFEEIYTLFIHPGVPSVDWKAAREREFKRKLKKERGI